MTDKQEKSSDNEMTFFEHIDALRPHLVRGFSALFIIMIVAFVAKKFIIDMVLMGPQSPDFPTNRWLCELSHRLFGDDTLCINHIKLNMVNTALGGQFNLHMQVSMVTGVVLAVPYLLWEIWRFVAPALTSYERYKSRMFVFYVSVCFFCGLLFGYFLIVPLSINFFAGYQASADITNMIDVRSYLTTVLTVSVACAAVFQLPLLIYYLTQMGIVTAAFLRKYRRHAIILLTIVSAVITPPDLFSLVLVILPLYSLYELSIFLARHVERKTKRSASPCAPLLLYRKKIILNRRTFPNRRRGKSLPSANRSPGVRVWWGGRFPGRAVRRRSVSGCATCPVPPGTLDFRRNRARSWPVAAKRPSPRRGMCK